MDSARAAGPSGGVELEELTPAQHEFAQLLGRLLARLWEQEQKNNRADADRS